MMYNDWPTWGGWLAMGLMTLAFVGFVSAMVVVVLRSLNQPHDNTGPSTVAGPDNPQRVLADRFARGEIDADEYKQRREVLRS